MSMRPLCLVLLSGACAAGAPGSGTVRWQDADGTRIPIPPPEHPRLFLRAEHARKLGDRLEDPVLEAVVGQLRKLAGKSDRARLEWEAIGYLVSGDEAAGRALVRETCDRLRKVELEARQDACRETGRWMVTGAIVYDWAFPLLTPEDRDSFRRELVRLAGTLECGYPPVRQGSVTGHSSEAMIMRDMLAAGIALYDEYPDMYELAAGRFFREHLPARNWLYDGHAYHQGDSYGPYRFSWDTFPLFIFDRLGAGNVYNPEQRFVPYLWIYMQRPDGQRLRGGDTFFHYYTPRGRPWGVGPGTVLTASYYGDGTLLSHHLQQGGVREGELLFEFLWRDTSLKPEPIDALPLSRYFGSPFGRMIARTGWDEQAAIVEMKINETNFTNHQHLDAGAFQIYYRGALAMDTGSYKGSSGQYGSTHCKNYYWRTIAHNSLLIRDPDEVFHPRGDYGNDGGQRLPNGRSEPKNLEVLLDPAKGYRTGEVLAHGFGPDPLNPEYTVLQGDITRAYSDKVEQVRRSFVFLNQGPGSVPGILVVFDRIVSRDPAFAKTWLLHTQEEPRIRGSRVVADRTEHGETGRLVLDALLPLPANAALEAIGGPGNEYRVGDTNFANDLPARDIEGSSFEPGAWRVELRPRAPSGEDLFLTVMQVTDTAAREGFPVTRVETPDRIGCRIGSPGEPITVLFRRDASRSGNRFAVDIGEGAASRVLVCDLTPGPWVARDAGAEEEVRATASEDAGCVFLRLSPGRWALHREEE